MAVKNNMTAQEKLIFFVQAKQDLLVHAEIFEEGEYLNDSDIEELAGWSDKRTKETLEMISKKAGIVRGFRSWSCPWCIALNLDCLRCGYGKRHGRCSYSNNNTWSKICLYGHSLATHVFYEELIDTLRSLHP